VLANLLLRTSSSEAAVGRFEEERLALLAETLQRAGQLSGSYVELCAVIAKASDQFSSLLDTKAMGLSKMAHLIILAACHAAYIGLANFRSSGGITRQRA
jgi:hypothetical protein